MPANLTQQYRRAENAYRRATSPDDELRCLQDMLRELPKHKGTDKLQAHLKQKISAAKKLCEELRANRKKGPGLRLARQGAARVVLLGGPNAGKSRFLQATTRATPEVADYPFTTREVTAAMMPFEDITFQLIDTPPITRDVFDSQLLGLIRGADVVLLMVDLNSDDGWDEALQVIEQTQRSRSRLAGESYLDDQDIGVSYTRALLVLNKCDLADANARWQLLKEVMTEPPPPWPTFSISAESGDGIPELQQGIFVATELVRVYTKSPKEDEAQLVDPFTVKRGGTVADIAIQVHCDFAERLKSARIWHQGKYGVADSITVKGDHVVQDKDVVELIV